MTCYFTIDNYVDSATYNGNSLTIITDAAYVENLGYSNLALEKLVNFESCDDGNPGQLSIKGSNAEVNSGTYLNGFFLLVVCTVISRFRKDLNLQIHLHKAFFGDDRFLHRLSTFSRFQIKQLTVLNLTYNDISVCIVIYKEAL